MGLGFDRSTENRMIGDLLTRSNRLDIDYKPVVDADVVYTPPRSVWELFSEAG